jgi:murein DD-endopeptidase MepM/ murein hydrolase activator NlpD
MKKQFLFTGLLGIVLAGGVVYAFWQDFQENNRIQQVSPTPTAVQSSAPLVSPEPTTPTATAVPESGLAEPVTDFKKRATKKQFGTFVQPGNSPVQPERFSGYHTGVDAEYADVSGEVAVYAITTGKVISFQRGVQGYGGVMAVEHTYQGQTWRAVYGHVIAEAESGASVGKGQRIARLAEQGAGTDGERKHLHLSLKKGAVTDLKGYVSSAELLSGWSDPLRYF